jgi:hypothetical protein
MSPPDAERSKEPELPNYPALPKSQDREPVPFVLDRWHMLLIYWAAGSISGPVVCLLSIPLANVDWIQWSILRDFFLQVGGICAGFWYAPFLFCVTFVWPRAKHPVAAASVCASAAGCVMLLMAIDLRLDTLRERDLIAIGSGMILAGIYGGIQSLLAEFVIRCWERWLR